MDGWPGNVPTVPPSANASPFYAVAGPSFELPPKVVCVPSVGAT